MCFMLMTRNTEKKYEEYTNVTSLFAKIMTLHHPIIIPFKRINTIYMYIISFVTTCRPPVLRNIHTYNVINKLM